MKKKIIYIAGADHSGTTILDMALSSGNQVIGLGELNTLIHADMRKEHLDSMCSCGKTGKACYFWNDQSWYDENLDPVVNYQRLVDYFHLKFGEKRILLDSSTNAFPYLSVLIRNYDLKVILITRDFRSWVYSRTLSTKRTMLENLVRWMYLNRSIRKKLKAMKIDPILVGYEELALYPEYILPRLCKSIGIEFSTDMLSMEHTNSHIISGNIARADKEKRKKITYDARWLLSSKIQLMASLFFFLQKFIRQQVYGNLISGTMNSFYLFGTGRRQHLQKKFD